MNDPLIIKSLLSVCGALLLVGVKLLIQLNDKVGKFGEFRAAQDVKNENFQKEIANHSVQIKELQKT
jgi:hypothetical protein